MGLVLLLFGMGALSVVAQTILVREFLVVVHGTELALGVLFGSWLLWIGVGAMVGARLRSTRWLAVLSCVGALLPIAEVLVVRGVPVTPFLSPSIGQTFALCLIVLAPFSLVIGVTFPLACQKRGAPSGRAIGTMYMAEAAGAVFGGLVFAFALAGRVSHLVVLGVFAAAVVALAPVVSRRHVLVIAAAMVLALPLLGKLDHVSKHAQLAVILPGQRIESVLETPYQEIVLAKMDDQTTAYGDGLPIATIPDPYETSATLYQLLAQAPAAERALLLGSTTTELAELLRAEGSAVTVVEPDERLASAVGAKGVTIADPRTLLRTTKQRYDLVFVDAPDPTAAHINRLYTFELFRMARRALTERGILCVKLTSAAAYVGRDVSDLAVSVRKALEGAFPHVVMTPGETSWLFASATQAWLTSDANVVRARLARFERAEPYRADIVLSYDAGRIKRLLQMTAFAKGATMNSDHHPSSYHYASVLWERTSGKKPSGTSWLTVGVGAIRGAGAWRFAAALGVLAALWLLGRRRAGAALDVGVAVFVAGLCAMALYFVLLLEYQSACGALYQHLAIMSALFMAGIAAGAGSWAPRLPPWAVLAGTGAIALVVAGAILVVEPWPIAAQQVVFSAMFVAAGACLGLGFAACAHALMRLDGASAGRAGGLMDAMDHLGATVGALVTGTLVLPAIGTSATLACAAALAGSAGVVLWILRGPVRSGTLRA
jgi:spermidine synthase